jgi:hypothetical protein
VNSTSNERLSQASGGTAPLLLDAPSEGWSYSSSFN